MQIIGGFINGGRIQDSTPIGYLYAFSTFTFTNANSFGNIGPTLSNCTSTYNTVANPWLTNTAYFNMERQGYQLWTVPKTGTYTIRAAGGSAGYKNAAPYTSNQITAGYCNGIIIEVANVELTQGTKIQIAVGQQGGTYGNVSGGGGGATWICNYTGNTNTLGDFIMVAGGGGSVNNSNGNISLNVPWGANSNARSTTLGNTAATGAAAGNLTIIGGNTYPYTGGRNTVWTGGGGGWYADGANSTQATGGRGGQSFLNGLRGGASNPSTGSTISSIYAAVGGFGGGGGSHGNSGGGGGGGGWTGGGGGNQSTAFDVGGGGGSYSQLPATVIGQNRGQGYVIITQN